tara:strand:+ start:1423 stop:2178 length:756 start_codon:yes stop_codon:yes gene_type:complete
MVVSLKHILALGILVSSTSALASTYTADFSGVNSSNTIYSSFSYSVGGVNMTMTAWSDTENNLSNNDTELESGSLVRYGSGWGVVNQDESGNASPDHSMDNMGSWVDYDMILVSFSEAVTLTGANFSWLYNTSQTEISVAAISGAVANGLGGSTWSDVVNSAGNMWSDSSHVSNYYAGINAGQTASQYWLVGAYNSIFNTTFSGGSTQNDGIKLSSIDFNVTSSDIPEPQTALIMAAGLFALILRRRKQIS